MAVTMTAAVAGVVRMAVAGVVRRGRLVAVGIMRVSLGGMGVVRGMELDINPDWVSGAYFHPRPGGPPQGFALFPDEKVSPQHYLTPSSRDWFAWFTR